MIKRLKGRGGARHGRLTLDVAARVLGLSLVATLSSACVEERALFIVQNQVPEDGCFIPAEIGDIYRDQGLLDVSVGKGYELFPVVQNDLQSSTGVDNQPERNRLFLRRYEVELDLSQIAPDGVPGNLQQYVNFSQPTSAALEPGGVRSASLTIIQPPLVPFLAAQLGRFPEQTFPFVLARVRAIADHNGSTVESTDFIYPVQVCSGCLVIRLADCPTADQLDSVVTNACGLPQDSSVTCCEDPNRGLICLATEAAN